jgi:hypothetical protein
MPFARKYTEMDVRGMLQIMEGNVNIKSPVPIGKRQPAHAMSLHGGSGHDQMIVRVLTKKQPNLTSAYQDFDTQVSATTEVLNSSQGQAELAKLDSGAEKRVMITAPLTNGNYHACSVKAQPKKAGIASTQSYKRAMKGLVICEKYIGQLLQIQTSYPLDLV